MAEYGRVPALASVVKMKRKMMKKLLLTLPYSPFLNERRYVDRLKDAQMRRMLTRIIVVSGIEVASAFQVDEADASEEESKEKKSEPERIEDQLKKKHPSESGSKYPELIKALQPQLIEDVAKTKSFGSENLPVLNKQETAKELALKKKQ